MRGRGDRNGRRDRRVSCVQASLGIRNELSLGAEFKNSAPEIPCNGINGLECAQIGCECLLAIDITDSTEPTTRRPQPGRYRHPHSQAIDLIP